MEYLYEPIDRQKKWANFFAEAGADLIIGTHPHVLQYIENLITSDGRSVPCYYSLGNFMSAQDREECRKGNLAVFNVKKSKDGKTFIDSYTEETIDVCK